MFDAYAARDGGRGKKSQFDHVWIAAAMLAQ